MGICDFLHCEGNLMGREQPRPELGIHYCHLPSKTDYGMCQQIPTAAFWPKLQRISRKLCLPTYLHRQCKYYHPTRSSMMTMWKKIAATNHPCIVHPCSRLNLFREFLMFVIWSYLYITRPLMLAFSSKFERSHLPILLTCCVCKILNIIMNFVTAYVVPKGVVILDHKKIARNYLLGYFVFDLFDALPLLMLFDVVGWDSSRHFSIIMFLEIIQFVRMPTYFNYIRDMMYLIKIEKSRFGTIICFLTSGCIQLHWLTCLVGIWPHLHHDSPQRIKNDEKMTVQYCICLYKVTTHFLLGSCVIENGEIVPIVITIILGCIFNVSTIANRIIWILNHQKTELRSAAHDIAVTNYLIAENISLNIQQRVHLFFKHKKRVEFTTEEKLNQYHSDHLRNEIYLHTCSHLISTNPMFRNLTKEIIGKIIVSLKPIFFLAGDIIEKVNDEGGDLILVSYGKVAFYTENGMEVCHDGDGSILGLTGFFLGQHCWTMVAIQSTEAFVWAQNDVTNMMRKYQQVRESLKDAFAKRYAESEMIEYEKRLGKFKGVNAKIHMLLRKRKILEQLQPKREDVKKEEEGDSVAERCTVKLSNFPNAPAASSGTEL